MGRPEGLRATDFAYRAIRDGLVVGRWPAGSHLRETELAAELNISRTPVREALRKLASEQLVHFEPHLGARVPGWSEQDLMEIFALRAELESYAAGQAAVHATGEEIEELRRLAEGIEQAAFGGPEPDYRRITEMNSQFHKLILVASRNRRLRSMVDTIFEIPLVVQTLARFDRTAMKRSVSHHFDLVQAIAGRNADWAIAIMRAHIIAGRQTMLDRRKTGDEAASV